MIEPSQRLQTIFENSIKLAKKLGHEYITIEHLVCSIMSDADSYNQIQEFGADANFIKSNLEHYLKNNLNDIKSDDADVKPKKTHSKPNTASFQRFSYQLSNFRIQFLLLLEKFLKWACVKITLSPWYKKEETTITMLKEKS